jgi:hypothetical protein
MKKIIFLSLYSILLNAGGVVWIALSYKAIITLEQGCSSYSIYVMFMIVMIITLLFVNYIMGSLMLTHISIWTKARRRSRMMSLLETGVLTEVTSSGGILVHTNEDIEYDPILQLCKQRLSH